MTKAERKNRRWAAKLGWSPLWFGLPADEFGPPLAAAIKVFQTAHHLDVDGVAGDATYRRLLTAQVLAGNLTPPPTPKPTGEAILGAGQLHPIAWDRVATPGEPEALELLEGFGRVKRALSTIRAAVIHWDATSSAMVTHRVLAARGIGTHFVIDWDGAIFQLVDLERSAWHAKGVNAFAVGIDLNNPVHPRHLEGLVAAGQPARPILDGYTVNGWKPGPFLGYHEVQIRALVALLAALARVTGIPLSTPAQDPRKLISLKGTVTAARLSGVYHHAQVDGVTADHQGKWDTLGLDLPAIVAEARACR